MDSISTATAADPLQSLLAPFTERDASQQQRIARGIASGRLTPDEAARLDRGADRIRDLAARAAEDGDLDACELNRLRRAQDAQSRRIGRLQRNGERACFAGTLAETLDSLAAPATAGGDAQASQPAAPVPPPALPTALSLVLEAQQVPTAPTAPPDSPPASAAPTASPAAQAGAPSGLSDPPQAAQPAQTEPFLLTGLSPLGGPSDAPPSSQSMDIPIDIPLDTLAQMATALATGPAGSGVPFTVTVRPDEVTLDPAPSIAVEPSALPFDPFA
jgi:hypothetical protein